MFPDEVIVKFEDDHSFLYNVVTKNVPAVVHGNGPIKVRRKLWIK